ncbi:MAG: hypothetical protein GXP08_00170 [Gammaproteobacteria bacterium]|nr:hypothetical protein [Gammaproteobacteria bacterium]
MNNLAHPLNHHLMIERSQKRWNLVSHLRLVKAENNDLLGHLVDLTTEGIMMISENPIPLEQTYNLRMQIPTENEMTRMVALTALSLWTKKDVNPNFHDTGFKLINPSKHTVNAIKSLINNLSFDI